MLLKWTEGKPPKSIWAGGKEWRIDPVSCLVLGELTYEVSQKLLGTGAVKHLHDPAEIDAARLLIQREVVKATPPAIDLCIQTLLQAMRSDVSLRQRLDDLFGIHDEPEISAPPVLPEELRRELQARQAEQPTPEPIPMRLPREEEPFEDPFLQEEPAEGESHSPVAEELQKAEPVADPLAQLQIDPKTATQDQRIAEGHRLLAAGAGRGRKPFYDLLTRHGGKASIKESVPKIVGRLLGLPEGWQE
jgi:hypothetical protein